jgi:hypothetical protein
VKQYVITIPEEMRTAPYPSVYAMRKAIAESVPVEELNFLAAAKFFALIKSRVRLFMVVE